MEKIKQLNTLIDQVCSQAHNQPPIRLYSQILHVIESRVDLPKHSITAIAKKLTNKSKKILFLTFDLLEYLSYNLELPFFSQIATKQFLFKISGLMMNKETDPMIMDKILKFIKCLDQIFRPLEDFLPLFFQFEAGLLRKQYQIPYEYVSPYRPKQLKQYKKPQKTEEIKRKPVIEPTRDEQKRFEQIRQKIILTNEIISNCDPSQDVRKNDLLQQLMEQLKQSQKSINATIDQNPSEKILELALATNDDLVTTYRRYKDLQRNRKPETFFMAELASDIIKQETAIKKKPAEVKKKSQTKIQSKPEPQRNQSIFEAFESTTSKKVEQSSKVVKVEQKKQIQNIFDLVDDTEKSVDVTQITQASQISDPFGLLDISPAQNTVEQNQNNTNLDLLGGSSSQNPTSMLINDIFSLNLGSNQPSNSNPNPLELISQPTYQQPLYQTLNQSPVYQSGNQQPMYNQPLYQTNMSPQFLLNPSALGQPVAQPPVYSNISLNLEEQKKPQEKPVNDPIKQLTDMSEFNSQFKF